MKGPDPYMTRKQIARVNPYMTRKQIASDLLSSHIWVGPSHDYRCASATIVMNGLSDYLGFITLQ